MPLSTTQNLRCDHIHDGKQCTIDRNVPDIESTDPFYHIILTVEVIDSEGTHQLMQKDVYTCRWDLYHELSTAHDQAMIDLEARKVAAEQAAQQLEAEAPIVVMGDLLL